MEVIRAATASCLKRKLLNILSYATYSSGHRQAGTPMINNQSTLRTALDVWQYCLVATVIHKQSPHSPNNIETLVGQKE